MYFVSPAATPAGRAQPRPLTSVSDRPRRGGSTTHDDEVHFVHADYPASAVHGFGAHAANNVSSRTGHRGRLCLDGACARARIALTGYGCPRASAGHNSAPGRALELESSAPAHSGE